jgi:hypothetical protein
MASDTKRQKNRWTAGALVLLLLALFGTAFSLMLSR